MTTHALRPYQKTKFKHHSPRDALEVRDLYFARLFKQTELAEIYKVSQGTVSRYVSGRVWK